MRVLFSHPNHPAQFRRLAPHLANQGHDVVFIAERHEWHAPQGLPYRVLRAEPQRGGGGASIHPYLRRFEQAVLQGQATFRSCEQLQKDGWQPDVIINHVGFGNGLYLGDAFPRARRIGLFEWYYNAENSDVDFLNRGPVPADRRLRLRGWNAQILLELAAVDQAVTPTQWQRSQFPAWIQPRLQVIHEGIDLSAMAQLRQPAPATRPFGLPNDPDVEVVTYLSRGFEEYRGFPQAIRALALLQQRRPNVHLLLAGSDVVAYGSARHDGRSWRQWACDELDLDPQRTHWLGMLQEDQYHQLLACSQVHLYLSVPFVLSWSLLEAMAAGCSLVASATPPVQEVLRHGHSAVLVDFWDVEAQAQAMAALLDNPRRARDLATHAQQAAQAYGADRGLSSWNRLVCGDTNQTARSACAGQGNDL